MKRWPYEEAAALTAADSPDRPRDSPTRELDSLSATPVAATPAIWTALWT
jgi:hypothetical protein